MGPLEVLVALIVLAVLVTPVLLLVRVFQARRDRNR